MSASLGTPRRRPDTARGGTARGDTARGDTSRGDRSTVAFATDHVERAKAGDYVGHHGAGDHALQPAGDQEAGRPDAHAVGRAAAVADQIETELAVAALAVRVAL